MCRSGNVRVSPFQWHDEFLLPGKDGNQLVLFRLCDGQLPISRPFIRHTHL